MSNLGFALDMCVTGGVTLKSLLGAALLLDLDAAHGVTLNGGRVSAWADQSGTGDANKNATEPTNQPLYNATDAAYNNKPTIGNFRADDQLKTGVWAVPPAQPLTYFVVGNSNGGNYWFDSIVPAQQVAMHGGSNPTLVAGGAGFSGGVSSGGSPGIIVAIFNGSVNSSIAVHTNTPQATGDAGTNNPTGITIGTYAGGASLSFLGKYARFIVANGALSAPIIASVTALLATTYGLTQGP